ncbi:hypothetical protein [Bacteroides sp.]|uniref:hypothetical protein n=1 Tax=Bacteroides sp. TaxID=29523 RepID=UPI002636F393|nr:hypothetical protein [Bacteroides sp.]
MTLLLFILIAIPISILGILIWIYYDYRKYKRQNNLIIFLFLLFPVSLSAQYVDNDCSVSFKWYENQKGKLEYSKNDIVYQFIPNSTNWKIIIKNTTTEDARVNWANTQLIINGRATEINVDSYTPETSYLSIMKGQTEAERIITVAASETNKAGLKIYDKKSIKKGNKAAVTIILPVSIGNQPQFFNTFDFIIK